MVLSSFHLKYPQATHTIWRRIDLYKWQVNFSIKKEKCTALFNSEGKWLETVTFMPLDKIPEQLKLTIEEKHNSNGLRKIYHVQTPDRSLYEMNLHDGIYTHKLLYDLSGKILGKMQL
jgi:hypothetical protein